ncbi:MAG: hypothetical protein PWQ63_11 [Methanolobus sp.]|jgi:hypothetical protein|nr:hypothetical protein [Methanolobus sp.]
MKCAKAALLEKLERKDPNETTGEINVLDDVPECSKSIYPDARWIYLISWMFSGMIRNVVLRKMRLLHYRIIILCM